MKGSGQKCPRAFFLGGGEGGQKEPINQGDVFDWSPSIVLYNSFRLDWRVGYTL